MRRSWFNGLLFVMADGCGLVVDWWHNTIRLQAPNYQVIDRQLSSSSGASYTRQGLKSWARLQKGQTRNSDPAAVTQNKTRPTAPPWPWTPLPWRCPAAPHSANRQHRWPARPAGTGAEPGVRLHRLARRRPWRCHAVRLHPGRARGPGRIVKTLLKKELLPLLFNGFQRQNNLKSINNKR